MHPTKNTIPFLAIPQYLSFHHTPFLFFEGLKMLSFLLVSLCCSFPILFSLPLFLHHIVLTLFLSFLPLSCDFYFSFRRLLPILHLISPCLANTVSSRSDTLAHPVSPTPCFKHSVSPTPCLTHTLFQTICLTLTLSHPHPVSITPCLFHPCTFSLTAVMTHALPRSVREKFLVRSLQNLA